VFRSAFAVYFWDTAKLSFPVVTEASCSVMLVAKIIIHTTFHADPLFHAREVAALAPIATVFLN
jgi:hypothetical protein